MNLFKILILLMVIPVAGFGQNHAWCGTTELDLLTERLKKNKQRLLENGVTSRDGVKYIPLKFHLIAKDDGSGRVNEKNVLIQLCALNEFYADNNAGVQFYLSGDFEYHDNTELYFLPSDDIGLFHLKVEDAVNIFIVASIMDVEGISPAGYYSPSDDMLVVLKNQIGATSTTLQHEIGHYFSLPHPFNGWDFEPWNPADHGNPVGEFAPGVEWPNTPIRTEKQDGSNCEIAGDYICDTPPDFRFSGGCDYGGGAMDSDGVLVDPDETNVMSYFSDNCISYISPEQIALFNADFDSRPELQNNFSPTPLADDASTTLLLPENNANTLPNFVGFEWEAVPGATHYYFELSRSFDFTLLPIRKVVSSPTTFVPQLTADKTYYWRVRPFNAYHTCTSHSAFNTFTTYLDTGVSTEIEALNDWRIMPNPVAMDNSIELSVNTARGFDAEISIISITGQTLRSERIQFAAGNNTVTYDIAGLAAGMYMVSIQTENARSDQKLIIAR